MCELPIDFSLTIDVDARKHHISQTSQAESFLCSCEPVDRLFRDFMD